MPDKLSTSPGWMAGVLWCAGVYNLLWGTFAVLFPREVFRWLEMDPPRYPQLWACLGMIVGV